MAEVTISKASRLDDDVTVEGTVDGVPVRVHVWLSHLQTLPTKAAKVTYVAQQMAAAVPRTPVVIDLAATVTV